MKGVGPAGEDLDGISGVRGGVGRGETMVAGLINSLVSLTVPVETRAILSYGIAGSCGGWSSGSDGKEDCGGSSTICNADPLMGALDAQDTVSFNTASEFVIIPIVGTSCSGSVGTVNTSACCILIAPSSVTCYEETEHIF